MLLQAFVYVYGVFLCVRVQVCIGYMGRWKWWGMEDSFAFYSSGSIYLHLRQGLSLGWSSPSKLGCPASKLEIFLSLPP